MIIIACDNCGRVLDNCEYTCNKFIDNQILLHGPWVIIIDENSEEKVVCSADCHVGLMNKLKA